MQAYLPCHAYSRQDVMVSTICRGFAAHLADGQVASSHWAPEGASTLTRRYTMIDSTVSRRGFVTAAAGVAVLGATVACPAFAEEAARTFSDTIEWAAEYDVVVLGMGFSGLVSAMAVADEGATVLICEKASDAEAGGNSKICGQMFAWTQGDVEAARAYYTALAADRAIPEDMLDILVNGVAGMGDTLSGKYGLDASVFTNKKMPTRVLPTCLPSIPRSLDPRPWACGPHMKAIATHSFIRPCATA